MKILLWLALVIAALTLFAGTGAIIVAIVEPELRSYTDYFWLSVALQVITAMLVIVFASYGIRNCSIRPRIVLPVLIACLFANVVDIWHAIVAYEDWSYFMAVSLSRVFPVVVVLIDRLKSAKAESKNI